MAAQELHYSRGFPRFLSLSKPVQNITDLVRRDSFFARMGNSLPLGSRKMAYPTLRTQAQRRHINTCINACMCKDAHTGKRKEVRTQTRTHTHTQVILGVHKNTHTGIHITCPLIPHSSRIYVCTHTHSKSTSL